MEDPKTTVRRNYPLAVAIPSDVSKSMPPRVRSWRVADMSSGHIEPCIITTRDGRTEEEAWLLAAQDCDPRSR